MASLLLFSLFTYWFGTIRAVVPVTGPPLELTNTSNGNPVYPEQEVTFTCTTRGSSILAWGSDHYIGEGSLLEFVAIIDTQGRSIKSTVNNNTVATLIYTNEDEQPFVLQSELRILVLSTHPQSTVLCHNVDENLEKNITFRVFDTPAQELNSSLQGPYACPGDRISFTCTTHSSTILTWKSKQYLGDGEQLEFLSVHQPGKLLTSTTNPNTSAQLVSISTENDIVSTLSITVLANLGDVRVHQITCINVDTGTRETITFRVVPRADCNKADSTPILPTTDGVLVRDEDSHNTISPPVIAGITIVLIVTFVITTAVNVIIFFIIKRKRETQTEEGISCNQKELLTELRPEMNHQWRRFGETAELKKNVLDKIGETRTDGHLSLVLDHWIRSSKDKKRTWTDVIKILRAMNQHPLADKIELRKIKPREFWLQETVKQFSAQLQQPLTHNDKWRNFGEEVNIPEEELDHIATNKDHRVSRMLEYWLKHTCKTEEPSWIDISEVLTKIDCVQAARDIDRIYIKNASIQNANQAIRNQLRDGNQQHSASNQRQNGNVLATSQAIPDPATSRAKPQEPATLQTNAEPPAISQAKPEPPANSQAKPQEPATLQTNAEPPANSQAKPEPLANSQAKTQKQVSSSDIQKQKQTLTSLTSLTSAQPGEDSGELISELPEINESQA